MKGIGAIVAGLAASLSGLASKFILPKTFRQGTYMRRTRVTGKIGRPGAKFARHADELRLGLRNGVSYPLKPTKRMLREHHKRMVGA